MKSILLIVVLLTANLAFADQPPKRKVAQANAPRCSAYVVSELVLSNLEVKNVKMGAFVNVYIGVGTDAKEANANAMSACQEGKFEKAYCYSALASTYSGMDAKYHNAVENLTSCIN